MAPNPPTEGQHAVAEHGDAPLLVLGPAGSGRSEALARRLEALVSRGEAPERVLVLTRSRADTAIKRWGLALKARVGHKRAVVAVARKLAVVLHAMWAKAQPFRTDAITATA